MSKIKLQLIFRVFSSVILVGVAGGIVFSSISEVLAYKTFYSSYIETDSHKIEFIGGDPGEQFGGSVASGDINRDGLDDLIVGSPYYSSPEMMWNGKVSIFLGTSDLQQRIYDTQLVSPNFVVYGRQSGDQLGISVDSGDFNGDGFDDILMGAYNAQSGDIRPGKAFLVLGREYYDAPWLNLKSQEADMEFAGADDLESFGLDVCMGDINNDDLDDILIGAPFALSMDGVKVGDVYGYKGWTFDVDSVDSPEIFSGKRDADIVFIGNEEGERFGSEIAVGNVVGGTYNDVIISAYFASGPLGPQTGKVYIYKGGAKYSRYERVPYDELVGENPYDWFGFSVDVGQANSRHKEDLLISTFPYLKASSGSTSYLLFGRTNFADKEYKVNENTSDYFFEGKEGEELMGASVKMADLDGDGQNDFVMGSPGVGRSVSNASGEVYIFYEKFLTGTQGFDISENEMTSYVVGENPDDWFGSKMATLDFNGDGYDDLAVSSRYSDRFDLNGLVSGADNGKVFLLLGHSVPFGDFQMVKEPEDEYVTRGEFINEVINKFDIKNQRKSFIDNCYQYKEFCFFAFSGQSSFSGLSLYPDLVLYPDVPLGSEYYEPVTVATMLGLVSGFMQESGTPFKPEAHITRIEALKVILGANKLVEPVYRFELIEMLGGLENVQNQASYYLDVDPLISHMWWYPRFSNFASENGLVPGRLFFRPDDFITKAELYDIIERTLQYLNGLIEENV